MIYRRFCSWVIILSSCGPLANANVELHIDGEDRANKMLVLSTEQELISKGCSVSSYESSSTSSPNLQINLTQFRVDRARGRFNGYGVGIDSAIWTGSVGFRVLDLRNNGTLLSSQESVEEREALSANGNDDLSSLKTDTQLLHSITNKLGRLIADRLSDSPALRLECNTSISNLSEGSKNNSTAKKMAQSHSSQNQLAPQKITAPEEVEAPAVTPASPVHLNPVASLNRNEYRVALVIGNTNYTHIPTLRNPRNDALLIAAKVKSAGFELVGGSALLDMSRTKLEVSISEFGKKLSLHPGAVGFFYYAGHGVQMNGLNFLVPIDANPGRIAEVSRQAIEVENLLQEMEDSRSGLNIIVLDACRNNPFGGRGIRESLGGLAQMKAPKGSFIVYATQPGNVAQDGPPGENSPFAKALAETIPLVGLDLFSTFNQVGLEVTRSTSGSQQPWISSSPIAGKFCFISCGP